MEKEREETIIHLLRQNNFASIRDIVKLTETSEATIRRDFKRLEHEGRIRRLRGGAELSDREKKNQPDTVVEVPFAYRKGILSGTKRRIAKAAVSLIGHHETIIIDGGSTTYQMAEYLKDLKLTIITNSFAFAEYLIRNGKSQIILPEGVLYPDSLLILNALQADPFRNYHASKVFMGAGGINDRKITNKRMDLIQAERSMIEHGDELVILADSRKFQISGNLYLCDLDRVSTIITDEGILPETAERIRMKGINLVIA
ncbi:MAG: DeoR/GlpR family DNA-binding transcription regulator [Spirochaetales bacterium]|nr:DeoR/GlpR family DNA-binding transcription regulator [Spirochaetales bacterium]